VLDEQFLIYVDGNFLIRNNLRDAEAEPEVLEFEVNIQHLVHFGGRIGLAIAVLEDHQICFVNLSKGFKLDGKITLTLLESCTIVRVRASEENLLLLCSTPQIIEIENILLASRLDSQVLEDRFRCGQIIKLYKFALKNDSHFSDFHLLAKDLFLLTGRETMLSWWQVSQSTNKGSALLSSLFKPLIRQEPKSPNSSRQPLLLEQRRVLNEADREISRILAVSEGQAFLDDSFHGRILQVHLDLGMIVKILKGYRNVAATQRNHNWLLWAGNRGSLQEFSQNPLLDKSEKLFSQEEAEAGSFSGAFLILFNAETNVLRILQ
jgi:hypothetical protein